MQENDIGTLIVDSAIRWHQDLRPALLETVNEVSLAAKRWNDSNRPRRVVMPSPWLRGSVRTLRKSGCSGAAEPGLVGRKANSRRPLSRGDRCRTDSLTEPQRHGDAGERHRHVDRATRWHQDLRPALLETVNEVSLAAKRWHDSNRPRRVVMPSPWLRGSVRTLRKSGCSGAAVVSGTDKGKLVLQVARIGIA